MAITIKPKKFGPLFVRFDGQGGLQYGYDANETGHDIPAKTPLDTMIAAFGACIVRSMEIAASGEALQPFTVELTGHKATDLPNRIGKIEFGLIGYPVDDPVRSAEIVAKAKAMCPVSNTMTATIEQTGTRAAS